MSDQRDVMDDFTLQSDSRHSRMHSATDPMAELPKGDPGRTTAYSRASRLRDANEALVLRNLALQSALDSQESAIDAMQTFLASVARAVEHTRPSYAAAAPHAASAAQLARLTDRQRQILAMVVGGYPNKQIAGQLGISQRTVENHRASIMLRTGSTSVPALTRLVFLAGGGLT
jgi:DNA-binding CsgD family transcriptional regulator